MEDEKQYYFEVTEPDGIRIYDQFFADDTDGDSDDSRWWDLEYVCPTSVNDSYMQENYLDVSPAVELDETTCDEWHLIENDYSLTLVVDGTRYRLDGVRCEGCDDGELVIEVVECKSTDRGISEDVVDTYHIECKK